MIIARSPAGLARFAHDPRWLPTEPDKVRPWTDDYTNLFGALWRRLLQKMELHQYEGQAGKQIWPGPVSARFRAC